MDILHGDGILPRGYFPDDYFGKLLPRHEVEWMKLGSNVCYLLVLPFCLCQEISYEGLLGGSGVS